MEIKQIYHLLKENDNIDVLNDPVYIEFENRFYLPVGNKDTNLYNVTFIKRHSEDKSEYFIYKDANTLQCILSNLYRITTKVPNSSSYMKSPPAIKYFVNNKPVAETSAMSNVGIWGDYFFRANIYLNKNDSFSIKINSIKTDNEDTGTVAWLPHDD